MTLNPNLQKNNFANHENQYRRDLYQHVTDTIVSQLEKGTVPWRQPWQSDVHRSFKIPTNYSTGNCYRGINILLLWTSSFNHQYTTNEWATFKQWNEKKESIRKGEKSTIIVYYDTIEKEIEGKVEKIPFIKSSLVFNRCQLASYEAKTFATTKEDLTTRVLKADTFVENTKAVIEHHRGNAFYWPSFDKITMPYREYFINTDTCDATEGYYSTLLHELTHWTGHEKRLGRKNHKKFADANYATEELVAELGTAFLCAEFDIGIADLPNHGSYIASWLKALKDNKKCIFTAASAASQAVDFLHKLQPSY